MERVKYLCKFAFCISLLLLVATFIDPIFPKSKQAEKAYQELISKYIEIGNDNYINESAVQTIVSKEEFVANISRDEVKERVYSMLVFTQNFNYIFDEEHLQEISEQFTLMYEQQQKSANNEAYDNVMLPIRIGLGAVVIVSAGVMYISSKKDKMKNEQEKDNA